MKKKIIVIVLVVLAVLLTAFVCTNRYHHVFDNIINKNDNLNDGDVVDKSFDAPKTIDSKDIIYFYAGFFKPDYLDDSREGDSFVFEITDKGNGTFLLKEQKTYNVQCEITADTLSQLDALLRAHDLISENGTDKVTGGLPPEFGRVTIKATYQSGEKLYVSRNNNPQDELLEEMVKFFKDIFLAKGFAEQVMSPVDLQGYSFMQVNYWDGTDLLTKEIEDGAFIKKFVNDNRILSYVNWESNPFDSADPYVDISLRNEEGRVYNLFYSGKDIPQGLLDAMAQMK